MKLRIRANSVRLRLTEDEVGRLGRGEPIIEQTHFPGGVLGYRLLVGGGELAARFTPAAGIEITLPRARAADWAAGTEVSLHGSVETADLPLTVLIEKDLKAERD